MAQLILGPVLRYTDGTDATVWVETDAACRVAVLGHGSRTFEVCGHHYALVHVGGLEPGSRTEYEVELDGERVWPLPGSPFPPSVITTPAEHENANIVFGSCRVAAPHEPPYALCRDADDRGREVDALRALALRMGETPQEEWPTHLLMLGDQVYADEVSPGVRALIRRRRDVGVPPGEQVADFEEYTRLYWESWSDPTTRWLLSTVPTAMIFDDHDVHDDWNISESWVRDARGLPWWEDRIAGAFMSYWIYQHVGNLSPAELHADEMYDAVCRSDGDAGTELRRFALRADRETEGARWSFSRDYGDTRLVVVDSRAGRVLGDGRRSMLDDAEWEWLEARLVGGPEHVVIASSLPVLLGAGMHYLEAWNEAVCDGAWGPLGAWAGEKIRRALDLEHWAAFGSSFERLMRRVRELGAGVHGPAPATITILSGDVHHAYVAEVAFPRSASVTSAVHQAVCSPFRNPLDGFERRVIRFGTSRPAHAIGRALARAAGVGDPDVRWRISDGPWFDNQVASLELDGRDARLRLERTRAEEWEAPTLHECLSKRLA